jgi:hypothetical protein
MVYIFILHTSPSPLLQARLQVHIHAYIILYTSPTIQIFIFQKTHISSIHSINLHTTVSSSLHYQFPTQPTPSLLSILAPNHHPTLQIHTLYSHPNSPIFSAPSSHTFICPFSHNRYSQQPILHSPFPMFQLTPTYQI